MHTFKWKWSTKQPWFSGLDEFLPLGLIWVEVHSGLGPKVL
jgi:hypothetical protein